MVVSRKVWEWAYIIRVLEHYNCLQSGKTGLGFAVGTEPLVSYFASTGAKVLASDLSAEDVAAGVWISTQQNAGGNLEALFQANLCTKEQFDHNVRYQSINMNKLPEGLGKYDFCWSSCAIEHVGSLTLSKEFLKNMLEHLKPSGIAVHTIEFNLSSNTDTIEDGDAVIFRKCDIEEMKAYFLAHGCTMETSYNRGTSEADAAIDIAPYFSKGAPLHINLVLDGYASTSFAIVVQKKPAERNT